MAYLEYNDKNRDKDAAINFDSEILKSGVNLDLPALLFSFTVSILVLCIGLSSTDCAAGSFNVISLGTTL